MHGLALGMAMNVCQALLKYAKQSQFGVSWQASDIRIDIMCGLDIAAFREAVRMPANGHGKAGFFEHGRIQKIGDGADFLYGLFKISRAVFDLDTGLRFVAKALHVEYVESHFHSDEILADGVVEFSSNSAALVLLGLEEAPGKFE